MSETTNNLPYTLRSIYLRNSSVEIAETFDPTIPGQMLSAIFRTTDGRVDCKETTFEQNNQQQIVRSCAVSSRFEFAYISGDPNNPPQSDEEIEKAQIAKITAEITADYLYNRETFPSQEDLQKWAASNAMLHSWPYWREYCHSTLLRMNLPVTIIPMIQFQEKSAEQ